MTPILNAVLALAGLGIILSLILGIAAKIFYVYVDPRIEMILDNLPGANCGGCGYAGCSDYAEAIVSKGAPPNLCVAAGKDVIENVCTILGTSVEFGERKIAKVFCKGTDQVAKRRFTYQGAQDCRAAIVSTGGDKDCQYGCIGLGTCIKACPFGGLSMGEDGIPQVNEALCTGCGSCARVCPREVIKLIPISQVTANLCSNRERGKHIKEFCSVGCIGCGICQKKCPEKAITMINGLAVVDPSKCRANFVCIDKCPTGSMQRLKDLIKPETELSDAA